MCLILSWFLLYCSGLEPNPQYLQGLPLHSAKSGKVLNTWASAPMEFGVCYPPSTWMQSSSVTRVLEAHQTLLFLVLMESSSQRHNWLNTWPLVMDVYLQTLFPPALVAQFGSCLNVISSTYTQKGLKGACYEKQDTLFTSITLYHLGNFNGFRNFAIERD